MLVVQIVVHYYLIQIDPLEEDMLRSHDVPLF